MATLDKIRSKAGCLVIAIGLAMAAFLAGDLINGGTTLLRAKGMNAFYVNGKEVNINDYNARVERVEEQVRARGQNLDEAQTVQLRNQVYNAIVAEKLLQGEADKIGLTVTPAETYQLVQGDNISPVILQNPMFANPETGAFDKVGLLNFLKQINAKDAGATPEEKAQYDKLRTMWSDTEKQVRNYALSEKYNNLIAKAIVANKLEVDEAVKADATIADIAYVEQKITAVSDSLVTVTDNDIKKYYDENLDLMKTEAGAVADLVYANISPNDADFAAAKADVEAARAELLKGDAPALVLQEYSDVPYNDVYLTLADLQGAGISQAALEFVTTAAPGAVSEIMTEGATYSVIKLVDKKNAPESLHVRHIVLAPKGSFEGQVNADSLFTAIQANPSVDNFSAQAAAHSLDRNSSANGGEIGWLSEAMATQYVSEDFAKAIYGARVGVPFRFTSKYGEHIVLVSEAKPNVDKYNIAFMVKTVEASPETQGALYNELSSFLANNKEVADLDTAALNAGYQVLKNQRISASQPMLGYGMPGSREVVRWIMQNKEGAVSPIMETQGQYIIAKVKGKYEAGAMPLESIKDEVKNVVLAEKKTDYLFDQLKKAGYTSLSDFAGKTGGVVDTLNFVKFSTRRLEAVGYQPGINAAAVYAQPGKLTPVKGNGSVYLLNVLSRTQDPNAATPEAKGAEISSGYAGMVRATALQEIMKKAKIEDLRYKFF